MCVCVGGGVTVCMWVELYTLGGIYALGQIYLAHKLHVQIHSLSHC